MNIDHQINSITTIQHISLQISTPSIKRTKTINYKQESHTTTSSRYSHDSNWRTSQLDTITNLPSLTPIETNSKLIDQQYSKKKSNYLQDRKNKNKNKKIKTHKKLIYKNKNYQQAITDPYNQSGIIIDNPTLYNESSDKHHPNTVNLPPLRKVQQKKTNSDAY